MTKPFSTRGIQLKKARWPMRVSDRLGGHPIHRLLVSIDTTEEPPTALVEGFAHMAATASWWFETADTVTLLTLSEYLMQAAVALERQRAGRDHGDASVALGEESPDAEEQEMA
jgi:hypothetical protein